MEQRAPRPRDGYLIDTLFPGLSNANSNRSSRVCSSPVKLLDLGQDEGLESIQSHPISKHKTITEENDKDNFSLNHESDGAREEERESLMNASSSDASNSHVQKASKKSSWSSAEGRVSKRKAGGPLKLATQPKQTYPAAGLPKLSRKGMFEVFQPWVLQTYGDSAKTKTITKKKYNRIVKTLRGEEINNAENSKFRFWVKAKGFHIGPPLGGQNYAKDDQCPQQLVPNEPELYVPTSVKDGSSGLEKPIFKRVAIVEYFFDIIYMVHVETEAKNGKHAGQKRTYRAITEKYAFLPREAVTKFLLQCTECQKRGSPGAESRSSGSGGICAVDRSPSLASPKEGQIMASTGKILPTDIKFGLPFTTTYSRSSEQEEEEEQMNVEEEDDESYKVSNHRMVKMSHSSGRKKLVPSKVKVKVRASTSRDPQLVDPSCMEDEQDLRIIKSNKGRGKTGEGKKTELSSGAMDWLGYQPLGLKKEATNNNIYNNGKHEFREQSSPLSLSDRAVNPETIHDETSSNGNKDDEDDDDDESEDRMDTHQHDPERLKAFNMFVRLFVDENLDRMVPISKQPKEKIQAIIDSCTRQFPEFAERARKRIRTYLKSCRRNKRSRDGGWESSRPTPAHLTSVQAEQILAQACENESQNAKRMRMGLEPVSQPLPMPMGEIRGSKENGQSSSFGESPEKTSKASSSSSHIAATIAAVASNTITANSPSSITTNVSSDQNLSSLNGGGTNGESILNLNQLPSSLLATNSNNKCLDRSPLVDYRNAANSMYRPNFSQTFQRPSPFPSLFPGVATSPILGALGNSTTTTFPPNLSPLPHANGDAGPTDLSMKSKSLSITQKLNATELATVRQLITGYRESAAFLLRSADELEQLLIQQQ